ncbi:acetylpolyamine amidohydrolase [Sinorhizobium medicae]|uniref:Acetylpolyamine amidohydrolase n=1 Tax=Sinorhizobium medicae TaxID=110321 RepID=A0ABX4TQC1_9HYPH|nr:histone deacetylase family protein [Sinorhizobium medicae]MDX0716397.1 histone deacetylase family protein [Sinorhizobium medicae]MDX0845909.1 histone deacetylase family protein [Sinorhizobium medicae]PLU06551.1 acetylpolyamine amidohydrolase [Sinorhizobium medicae]PLU06837.1 acetylpolyamine amidohydrolase [Sinorhizobium medicae]PLU11759.1 acetylpolyamine amidohydrolase [Sinorhizobium medicae]
MKVVYSNLHRGHVPGVVVENGLTRPSRDVPERLDALLRAVKNAGLDVVDASDHGRAPLAAVHSDAYLDFLANAYQEWQSSYLPGRVLPAVFETKSHAYRDDWSVIAKAGFFLRDQVTPVDEGTWLAAYWSAQTALTAAELVKRGERQVYALCRPSGHHAGRDFGGGATYLNNVAIAATWFAGRGERVAILDVDVHHGNGTQDIFWNDDRFFFSSVHRSPAGYYPHFTGYRDEVGGPAARGSTFNWPLLENAADVEFIEGFKRCLGAALGHDPVAVFVSLGFDALASDPANGLQVTEQAYETIGTILGSIEVPVLLIQEGGYDLGALESVARRFLSGFAVTE